MTKEITGKDGTPMVLIPAGPYTTYPVLMFGGGGVEVRDAPISIYVDEFYIDRTPVTAAKYAKFADIAGRSESAASKSSTLSSARIPQAKPSSSSVKDAPTR